MNEIITTRSIRDRYAAVLREAARQRHEAAYEWTRLRWWQWRKRRRLYRVLYGIGGWRAVGLEDAGIPERVVLTHRGFKARNIPHVKSEKSCK